MVAAGWELQRSDASLSYAVVTAVRDEADCLPSLARSLFAQTVLPKRWLLVDTGSRDGTESVIAGLARASDLVDVICVDGGSSYARGGAVVAALHAGFARLPNDVDLVAKVDADVTMPDDHFARLLARFAGESRLGIVSGTRYEFEKNVWRQQFVTAASVEAQYRVYRAACLSQILPFDERLGWDTVDEIRASLAGWTTEVLLDLPFLHHRPVGARDGGRWRAWRAQGHASHYLHYRPSYILLRALHRARREPAALGLVGGFVAATLTKRPRHRSIEVRASIRDRQRLRFLLVRGREALGSR